MRIVHLAIPVLTLALVGGVVGQEEASYEKADAELQEAMARATVHNKRVLAVLVAEGEDLATAWRRDPVLRRPLSYEFETVQYAGREADARAVTWKFPDAMQNKPALVVLSNDGKVLDRLQSDAFTAEGKVEPEAMLAKLKPHYCAPVSAENKLAAASIEAEKTGRNVFIRFDAPW